MSLMNSLIKVHGNKLTSTQLAKAKEYARRNDARVAYAYPENMTAIEAQSTFITFEREFCNHPVYLFGQDVLSVAHTIIRVFRARNSENENPGENMSPAEEIFSARISEKALTEMILATNRGDRGAPLTVTSLGGSQIAPRRSHQIATEEAAIERIDNRKNVLRSRLEKVFKSLDEDMQKPTKEMRQAVSDLQYNVRDAMKGGFDVERHMENMVKVKTQLLTEAAYAALHSEKVSSSLQGSLPMLPAPDEVDWDVLSGQNPMVDAMLDPLDDATKDAINALLFAELEVMAVGNQTLTSRIGKLKEEKHPLLGSGQSLSGLVREEDQKKHLEKISSLMNWTNNPSVQEGRLQQRADQASISLGNRYGSTHNIHSTIPAAEQDYYVINIAPAYFESRLGSTDMRSKSGTLIELEIVAQDLMTAIRGHPTGMPTPCSLRQLAGVWMREQQRDEHVSTKYISSIDSFLASTPEAKRLDLAFENLQKLANAKRSGKTWRNELNDAMAEFQKAMWDMEEVAVSKIGEGRQDVTRYIAQKAKKSLTEISVALPEGAIKALGLPDK